jgi:hypothetical protein
MTESYSEFVTRDARLVILKELSRQVDGRLNENLLVQVLDSFAYRRSRDWVRTQLRAMSELGVITVQEVGTVMVASITKLGVAHVERREIVEGIGRPSPEA